MNSILRKPYHILIKCLKCNCNMIAVAMSGGLFVATILTLLVLHVIYASWYRVDKKTKAALGNQVEETINEKEIDNSINALDNKPD